MFFKEKIISPLERFFDDARWLAIWVPVALIVPNVVLSITEPVSALSAATNIILPLGVYLLSMAACKRTGIQALLMIPFMFFAAFQIVLLYLYGGSVIAVDMFLNVVTTNVSEATELLGNLMAAMGVVLALYVPPIVWGICAAIKKSVVKSHFRRKMGVTGGILTLAGIILSAAAVLTVKGYSFIHETFPVNAISNMVEAFRRYSDTERHEELSAAFSYKAVFNGNPEEREAYIFVIGETARGDNWQLGGYDRPTNPYLAKEEGVVFFPKSISESNTTHKSVPMLISFANAENFDSISHFKSIITAFKEAGFSTAFISNQLPNRSFTEHFGNEADTTIYIAGDNLETHPYDEAVLAPVDRLLGDTLRRKQLIVVHTYGSHFKYQDRYPKTFSRFKPDDAIDARLSNRDQLINAYDNTILYTDFILHSLISRLKQEECRAALLYAADHGEDIFDDERHRFLHASPVPTYWQIHQASLVWLSPRLATENPEMHEALCRNSSRRVSPQKSLFPTAMQLASIESPMVVDTLSLVSPDYNPAPPVYLNDLNQARPITACGLREADLIHLAPLLDD